jgi:hypothetical protein
VLAGIAVAARIRAFTAPRQARLWPFVSSVAFSPDGATSHRADHRDTGRAGQFRHHFLWQAATGRRMAALGQGRGAEAIGPGGKMLTAVGGYGNSFTTL